MPKSTNPLRRRHRQALVSALVSGAGLVLTAAAEAALGQYFSPGLLSTLFYILAAAQAALLLPLAVCLRGRLKEIQGGEEDEARQY